MPPELIRGIGILNDDVNMSRWSNATFPTAMHITWATVLKEALIPALQGLQAVLQKKSNEFDTRHRPEDLIVNIYP